MWIPSAQPTRMTTAICFLMHSSCVERRAGCRTLRFSRVRVYRRRYPYRSKELEARLDPPTKPFAPQFGTGTVSTRKGGNLLNRPNVVCDTCLHCRSDANRLIDLGEVVEH